MQLLNFLESTVPRLPFHVLKYLIWTFAHWVGHKAQRQILFKLRIRRFRAYFPRGQNVQAITTHLVQRNLNQSGPRHLKFAWIPLLHPVAPNLVNPKKNKAVVVEFQKFDRNSPSQSIWSWTFCLGLLVSSGLPHHIMAVDSHLSILS